MDNFPYPNHLNIPRVEVPYLSGFEFDHLEFSTFPERLGFMKDGALDIERPCRQLAAMAQSWLYFGLIDIFTSQRLNKSTFIRQGSGLDSSLSVVDSTALDGILEANQKRLRKNSERSAIRAQLLVAAKASSELDRVQGYDHSSAAVFLSIKILILCLFDYSYTAFGLDLSLPRSVRVLKHEREDERPLPAWLLIDRMRQAGWCIHRILELCHSQDYCILYYLSSIRRHEPGGITHKNCSETKCSAYNTNEGTYKIRHTDEQCQCEFIEAPFERVASIVKDGGIPLIGLRPASGQDVELEVMDCTPHSQYTAISHTWIDGLGNPTANALPRCQLRKLATELSNLAESQRSWYSKAWKHFTGPSKVPPLMWMDTLCIPVQSEHADLRMKAINRMALIYTGAKQVLVLDAELRQVDCRSEPRELGDARIFCSKWNERCWTLQEGALARKCLFQFRDSATIPTLPYRHPHLGQRYIRQKLFTAVTESAMTDLNIVTHAQRRLVPDEDWRMTRFVRSWNEVGRRSTTKAADIHVILANLTVFKAAQIMSLSSPVERTQMMLHCIGRFPLDMLYNDYPRPEAGGNHADRWVPSVPSSEPLSTRALLRCAKEGLVLEAEHPQDLPDIFHINSAFMPSRFCFRVPHNEAELWYWVECIQPTDDELPRHAYTAACLVVRRISSQVDTSALRGIRGARLLATEGKTDKSNKTYARFDCPVVCIIKKSPPRDEELTSVPIMVATKLPDNQKLVIEQGKYITTHSHSQNDVSDGVGSHR